MPLTRNDRHDSSEGATWGLLEAIIEGTSDMVAAVDADLALTAFTRAYSREFERLFNKKIRIGDRLPDLLMHEQGAARDVVEAWRRALSGESLTQIRDYGTGPQRKFYELCLSPVRGADGRIIGVSNIARDVTRKVIEERRHARELTDLKIREQQFEVMVNTIPQLAWMTDESGSIFWYNSRWYDYTGRNFEEMKGWGWADLHHPDHVERVVSRFREAVASGSEWEDTFPLRRHDGEYRWFLSRAHPILDADGNVRQFFGTNTDVTDQLAGAEELRRSREKFRHLAEAMPQMVWTTGEDGEVNYFNSRWYDFSGLSPEASLGYGWASALHPDDYERAVATWTSALAQGKDYEVEYRFRGRGGEYRWFLGRAHPVRSEEDGRIEQWFGTTTDIHEFKELEDTLRLAIVRAEAASTAKSDFLATMSHEIRTPMNSVIGIGEILERLSPSDPRHGELVKTLQKSADSLMSLINDLLDISKIEAGTQTLEHIPFSLADVLEDVISIVQVRAEAKGLAVEKNTDLLAGRQYLGDPSRIQQVLLNIASNAVKFTTEGTVSISAISSPRGQFEETVTISIADTGIGIPAEQFATIFKKFLQGDSSTSRRYGGSGLGLAISKAFVDMMHGEIEVESEVGCGSVFRIHLPLEFAEASAAWTSRLASGEGRGPERHRDDKCVLIVDDYEPNLLVAETLLEEIGYAVETASSGHEALRRLASGGGRYCAVLMDIQMPGLDGIETTRLIRAAEKCEGAVPTKIIAMTAHAFIEDRERCMRAGMDGFISKPVDIRLLKTVLGDHCGPRSS